MSVVSSVVAAPVSGRSAAGAKSQDKNKREEIAKSGILHGPILVAWSTNEQDYGGPSAKYISEVHTFSLHY